MRPSQELLIDALCRLEISGYRVMVLWPWLMGSYPSHRPEVVAIISNEGIVFLGWCSDLDKLSPRGERYKKRIESATIELQELCAKLIFELYQLRPDSDKNVSWKFRLLIPHDQIDAPSADPDSRLGYLFPKEIWELRALVERMFITLTVPSSIYWSDSEVNGIPRLLRQSGCQVIPITDYESQRPLLEDVPTDVDTQPHQSAIFEGGPGTGKTWLLIQRAIRLASQGERVLFVCYNKPLAGFLERQMGHITGIVVYPVLSLCEILARKVGPLPAIEPGKETEYWNVLLPELAVQGALQSPPRFDHILVDEAQDFRHATWWQVLKTCHGKGETGPMAIAWDPGQGIYLSEELAGQDDPEHFFPPVKPITLNVNHRNPRKVASELNRSGYWNLTSAFQGVPMRGGYIERIKCSDLEHWAKGLHDLLNKQPIPVGNRYEPGIVILGPKRFEKSVFAKANRYEFGPFTIVNEKDISGYDPMQIPYFTVHRFKGLEADKVILVDFEERDQLPRLRRLFFLGLSRCRQSLWIMDH
jgi:hypothetical protein